jgi:hypothetical protein
VTVLLYLDENVNRQLGLLLLALGFDVVFARNLHPPHTSDHIHLASATRDGRILISHDRDYLLLHRAWRDWFKDFGPSPPPRHAGILLIPQEPVIPKSDAAMILRTLLGSAAGEAFSSRLLDWTARYGWQELD